MGQTTGESEIKAKLVVVGDCGCGKTTMIKRYISNSYTDVSVSPLS
jgi:GTPase SAR1 family protein